MTEIPNVYEISIEVRAVFVSLSPELLPTKLKKNKVLKKKFTVTVSEGSRKRPFKIYVAGLLPLASCCGLELADDLE